jgi:hypothetical protein
MEFAPGTIESQLTGGLTAAVQLNVPEPAFVTEIVDGPPSCRVCTAKNESEIGFTDRIGLLDCATTSVIGIVCGELGTP